RNRAVDRVDEGTGRDVSRRALEAMKVAVLAHPGQAYPALLGYASWTRDVCAAQGLPAPTETTSRSRRNGDVPEPPASSTNGSPSRPPGPDRLCASARRVVPTDRPGSAPSDTREPGARLHDG